MAEFFRKIRGLLPVCGNRVILFFWNGVWPGELPDSGFKGNGMGGMIYNFVNFLCFIL
jgi:hypothetical protein